VERDKEKKRGYGGRIRKGYSRVGQRKGEYRGMGSMVGISS